MIAAFLVTFRETLEAALIVGIVLSYLVKTGQIGYRKSVYSGIFAGIVASLLGAALFNFIAGGFQGRGEQIFEGFTVLTGAVLLTTVIVWMAKQKNVVLDLQRKVENSASSSRRFGLFFLVFFSILREGIETIFFLQSVTISSGGSGSGAVLGIIVAMVLGYLVFKGTRRINLKTFFNATSILLILFAAGMVAYGVHELQEAGIIPTIVEHIWDINPAIKADSTYPLLHEKGALGEILKGLFGYNGNPSLIEVISYMVYLVGSLYFWAKTSKQKTVASETTLKQNT